MTTTIRSDLAPGELDPELQSLVAQLERLGAADRASASAALESLVADRSAPELRMAPDPLPIIVAQRPSRLPLRLAAAIGLAAAALSVYLASLSSPTADPTLVAQNLEPAPSTAIVAMNSSTAMVNDWAALSSLYEDISLNSEIDILSAEVARLHSSLDDSADSSAPTSGSAGGAS